MFDVDSITRVRITPRRWWPSFLHFWCRLAYENVRACNRLDLYTGD